MSSPQADADSPAVQASPTGQDRHYLALDGLRGVAILAVFLYHFGGASQSPSRLVHIWSAVVGDGWVGVDLFFVLSGFLITGILFDTARKQRRVRNFYARRALRIFPLFYGVLFAFLLLTPILHLQWHRGHILYFVYLSNMMPMIVPGLAAPGDKMVINHFWSLSVEEQFYLLWPFVVWWVKDRRKLMYISVAIMVAALLLRVYMVSRGLTQESIFSLLPTRADSLACGALVALLVRGPAAASLPVRFVMPIAGVATLGVLMSGLFTPHSGQLIPTVGYTFIAVFSACLVYAAQRGQGWVSRFGSTGWLRFVGRYSYGLYIFQGLLLVFLRHMAPSIQRFLHSAILGGIVFLCFAFSVNLALAMLSYHYFEAPILRLKRHFA